MNHSAPPSPLTPADAHGINQVANLLRDSKSVLVITGAGLSADSGLPTYRGTGGLYDGQDPEEGVPIESLMAAQVLQSRPEVTWKYLMRIEQVCRDAKPNRGHDVIAAMEPRFERFWVLTQNVDGFHRQAGSRNVIDIHGDLHGLRCMSCPHTDTVVDYTGLALPPRCPTCGGILRPDVVLFGEQLPERQLATYYEELRREFDLVLSIGTTSQFPYIAAPVLLADRARKPSVEINPGETEVTEYVSIKLPLRAAPALDALWTAFTN